MRLSRLPLRFQSLESRIAPAVIHSGDHAYTDSEILVRLQSSDPLFALTGTVVSRRLDHLIDVAGSHLVFRSDSDTSSVVIAKLRPGVDPQAAVTALKASSVVGYAEPNWVTFAANEGFPADAPPSDPSYGLQWHLGKMKVDEAWKITTGSKNVVVAVLDDGLPTDVQHSDLKLNRWTNPTEKASNGIDEDGNGFIDDVYGWDFFDGDKNPQNALGDTHGTQVAGIIAATTNNGATNTAGNQGVAGVAGGDGTTAGARLMSVRIAQAGTLSAASLIQGLTYAVDNGAKIVNISYNIDDLIDASATVNGQPTTVISAFDHAYTDKKALVFVSAGNNNVGTAARGKLTSALFVANTNADDLRYVDPTSTKYTSGDNSGQFKNGSNYGTWVDLSAPGTGIVTTFAVDDSKSPVDYLYTGSAVSPQNTGTSFAAPNAAAVAALIWSKNPSYTRDQVASRLLGSTDGIDGKSGVITQGGQTVTVNNGAGLMGTGRVNALKAVDTVTFSLPAPKFGEIVGLPDEGKTTSAVGAISISAPARFDPTTVKASSFELKRADGTTVALTVDSYQMGSNAITVNVPGSLTTGTYTFTAKSGFGGLRSPFGVALDGNGDGAGGDAFVRTFQCSVLNRSGDPTVLSKSGTTVAIVNTSVVSDSAGNYTVAYTIGGGGNRQPYLRRFDRMGVPLSPEVRAGSKLSDYYASDLAIGNNGNIVLVTEADGGGGIYARVFSPTLAALTPEIRVDTGTATSSQSKVAIDPSGNFTVVWVGYNEQTPGQEDPSYGIFMRQFTSAGVGGPLQRINQATGGNRTETDIVCNSVGEYSAFWASDGQDGDGFGIYRQRFSSTGSFIGSESRVNATTTGSQRSPRAAFDAANNLLVTWDVNGANVDSRCFSFLGEPYSTDDVRLNATPNAPNYNADVSVDPTGGFIASWDQTISGYNTQPVYRRVSPEGVAAFETEVSVPPLLPGNQVAAAAAANSFGDVVYCWYDGASASVSIQRFTRATAVASVQPSNDSNLIDPGERLVQPLTTAGLKVTFASTVNEQSDQNVTSGKFPYAGSVLNPANWSLTRDGVAVPLGTITATTVNGQTVVTLPNTVPINSGHMVLTAKASITDEFGQPLDGDADGQWGGDFVRTWDVQAIGTAGQEFRLNTTTTGEQAAASVVALRNGGYMAFWYGADSNAGYLSIFGQRLNQSGAKIGGEFVVNSFTGGDHDAPRPTLDADGNVIVVWTCYYHDGSGLGIFGQRLDPAGNKIGIEFPVNTYSTGNQRQPDIAADSLGNFVVTWTSEGQDGSDSGVYFQRFTVVGSTVIPVGGETLANNVGTNGPQSTPKVATDRFGNYFIVWASEPLSSDVKIRKFGFSGGVDTGEVSLPFTTSDVHILPGIGCDNHGNLVVTFGRPDGDAYGAFVQGFYNDLTSRFPEVAVDNTPAGNQGPYDLVVDPDGGFVVLSVNTPGVDAQDVFARRFLANGTAIGPQFLVNTYTTNFQYPGAHGIAMQAPGEFLITWTSYLQDGDNNGVYAQRYGPSSPPTSTPIPAQVRAEDGSISTIGLSTYFADAEEAAANLTYSLVSNSSTPTVNASVSGSALTLAAVTNAFGVANIVVRATDSAGLFADSTISVTIQPVNDAPAFTLVPQPNLVVPINYTLQTYPGFVTSFTAGPTNESAQTPTYEIVGNTNPQLFTTLQILPDGMLQFDPADDNYGAAVIQVRVHDSGGTTNGGVDVSPVQSFVITVTPDYVFGPVYASGTTGNTRPHTYTTGTQSLPAVGVDATGNTVVTWSGEGLDDIAGIYAQRYSNQGTAVGSVFRVNTTTTGVQTAPAVAVQYNGDFVIAWQGNGPGDADGVFFQRFKSDGTTVGGETRINAQTASIQDQVTLAADGLGNFMAAYRERPADLSNATVVVAGYDAASNQTFGYWGAVSHPSLTTPRLAMAPNRLVLAWQATGDGDDVWFRTRSGPNFNQTTNAALANSATAGSQRIGDVACDVSGNAVITFTGPGNGDDVYFRRIAAGGTPLGTDVRANFTTTGDQGTPRVSMDADGDFAIVWAGAGTNDPDGIVVRRFNSDGSAIDTKGVLANATTIGAQVSPAIALDHDGEFVVAFASPVGPDPSDVYLQRFGYPLPPTQTKSLPDQNIIDGVDPGSYTVTLSDYFSSAVGKSEAMDYTVFSYTNSNLFATPPSVDANRVLTVIYRPGASGTSEIRVRVKDTTEAPLLSTFRVTVRARNDAPTLAAIPPLTVNEGSLLTFTAVGADAKDTQKFSGGDYYDPINGPGNVLTYKLMGEPSGATIDPTTGKVSWTPTDGPSTVTFTVRVFDNGRNENKDGSLVDASLFADRSVTVTVNNIAPNAAGLFGPASVEVGKSASFTLGSPNDAPGDLATLKYSFDWDNDGTFDIVDAASPTQSVVYGSPPGVRTVRARIADKDGGAAEYTSTITVTSSSAAGPKVQGVTVNDGSVQRSRVTSLTVAFNSAVDFAGNPADAFVLTRQGGGNVTIAGVDVTGSTAKLTFSGPTTQFASLIDGRYTLTILANQVSAGGTPLDGNGDGTAGDDYSLVGNPTNKLFRLYGDADGSGQVTSSDFLAFRLAFLSPSLAFDYNGSGTVDSSDFLQFRLRFLQSV